MKKPKVIKVGGSVTYVNTTLLRAGKSDHRAKVVAINADGSLVLLVNFKGVGKIPFASVPPMQTGKGVAEYWR